MRAATKRAETRKTSSERPPKGSGWVEAFFRMKPKGTKARTQQATAGATRFSQKKNWPKAAKRRDTRRSRRVIQGIAGDFCLRPEAGTLEDLSGFSTAFSSGDLSGKVFQISQAERA